MTRRGRRPAMMGLIVGLCIALSPAARAQEHGEEAAPKHGEPAAHESSHAESSPNILSGDLGNVIWTWVIFLTLLGVLGKFAWKPILGALQRREEFIHNSLETARREREEAERLLKDYTQRIEKARVEATAIVEEGKRDAETVRKKLHEEAKKEADDMIARARREIQIARDDAVKDLYERTLALSTETAAKIIRRQLNPADHKALLDESIAEMAQAKH